MTKFRYVATNANNKIIKTEWFSGDTKIETLNTITTILNAKYKKWFIEFK